MIKVTSMPKNMFCGIIIKLVQLPIWTAFSEVCATSFLRILCIITIGLLSIAKGEIKIEDRGIIFKPIEIKPSPNGESYKGVFSFVNNTKKTIKIPLFEIPVGKKLRVANTVLQTFANGKWTQEQLFNGGLAQNHLVEPGAEFQLFADIGLEELSNPVIARLGFAGQNLWSEPFGINWIRDRDEGNLLRSNKLHFQKVKEAFEKAGFKSELLGDGFCDRFFSEMIVAISAQQKNKLFEPVSKKVAVLPRFYLDGEIDATVNYDNQSNENPPLYNLKYSMDPLKFNRKIFNQYRKDIQVLGVGTDLVMMLEIRINPEDKALFDLRIRYRGEVSVSDSQLKMEASEAFERALAVVDQWLR